MKSEEEHENEPPLNHCMSRISTPTSSRNRTESLETNHTPGRCQIRIRPGSDGLIDLRASTVAHPHPLISKL